MRSHFLVLLSLSVVGTVRAEEDVISTPAYKECIALATEQPAKALAQAEQWIMTNNGIAAYHCRAIALYGLQRYPEAAEALSRVRRIIPEDNLNLRSFVSRQVSAAWLKSNRGDAAMQALTLQINELGQARGRNATAAKLTSDLLLDRARINIGMKRLSLATKDLDHAISLNPVNIDALLERATTFELLNDFPLAKSDAEAALTFNPYDPRARKVLARIDSKLPPVSR